MSDTPIDQNLDSKQSTRFPPFMLERIDRFCEEYNEMIATLPFESEDTEETFSLDSRSDAIRRLIDAGLGQWEDREMPYGFSFEHDGEETIQCPECGTDDPARFRIGGSDRDGEVVFETVRCLGCDYEAHRSEMLSSPGFTF